MKKIAFLSFAVTVTTFCMGQPMTVNRILDEAAVQTQLMLKEIPMAKENEQQVVPRTMEHNKLKVVPAADWTSGFFPGVLWYLYEHTGQEGWKEQARNYTALLEKQQYNSKDHDIGFRIFCSYGNGYRLTGQPEYKNVIIQSAKTLATRFNTTAGVIKSWQSSKRYGYPVIIDNMMNLELLFAATRLTGDSSYYNIAVTHALSTLRHHFRDDNSSYHALDYDTISGKVIRKLTHQGYSDSSAWARGQAWGLYGYTVCYRETKDRRFLEQAEKIASFILDHPRLPADKIPYWDFDAPASDVTRDASAAAITASALYELAGFSGKTNFYISAADTILMNLSEHYRSPVGKNKGFILLHSTGHKPAKSEIDVPINYADYYFIEALFRCKQLKR